MRHPKTEALESFEMIHFRVHSKNRAILAIFAIAALAIALVANTVTLPTGKLGQSLLHRMIPDTGAFQLTASSVSLHLPSTAILKDVSLKSGLEAKAPRLEIHFSPWWLMTGKLKISDISAPELSLRTNLSAANALETIDALNGIPLRKWFPSQLIPTSLHIDSLAVSTRSDLSLLRIKNLSLRRHSETFELRADSALVMGFLPTGHWNASGKLPLSLDTFQVTLPDGQASGHLENQGHSLTLLASAKLALGNMPLHLEHAHATGNADIHHISLQIPLGKKSPHLSAQLLAHKLHLTGFSYEYDPWVKHFAPELRQITFSRLDATVAGPLDGTIAIESLKAEGDTLKLEGKGWINLEGELSMSLDAGLCPAYAKTRPSLMQAALDVHKDGYAHTGATMHGTLRKMQVAPGKEAYDNALSHPFKTLGALLR